MIKEEIAPGIIVYSNVIPKSESLYKDIENGIIDCKLQWSAAEVKESSNPMVNTKTRDTSSIGIPYMGKVQNTITAYKPIPTNLSEFNKISEDFFIKINNIFFENFDPIEKDYMATYGIGSEWHDSYGILKYGAGQQFINHIDDHPSYPRRVSTVYYLNENYKGGEINFPRFNITFKPKANQMIIFPSTYVYNHSVSRVIEGERYAVVSWLR
jgi:hypothetical protein